MKRFLTVFMLIGIFLSLSCAIALAAEGAHQQQGSIHR